MSIASAFVRLLMHAIVIERYWLRQVGRDMTKCVACVLLRRRHRAWRGAGTAGTSNNRVQASSGHLEVGAGPAWSGAGAAGTSNNKVQAPPVQRVVGASTAGIGFCRRRHRAWPGAGTAGTSNNRVQASPGHLEVGAGTAGIGFYRRRHATPFGVIKV